MASFDIVVVGGGPTGLAAALLARNLGRSTALVAPERPADERTSALLAGSIDLLERLDVFNAIKAEAAPLRRIRLIDATARLIRAPEILFDAAEIGLEAFGYNIPNRRLTEILDRAADQRSVVRVKGAAIGVHPRPDRVGVDTSEGSLVDARLAIAADGRHSIARAAAGITTRDWTYDQVALVVNLRHTRPHGDTSTEFHTATGPFTLVPLGDNRSSLVWVDKRQSEAERAHLTDTELAEAIETRSGSLLGAITIDGPRQTFPLSGMRANHFADHRIALVGEAAHVIPPIGAQGLNLGLRDVSALAALFAGPTAADPGSLMRIAAFDRARRADVVSRSVVVDGLNRSLLTDSLLVQASRGLGMHLLHRVPFLRKSVMRQGMAALDTAGGFPAATRKPTAKGATAKGAQGKKSAGRIRLPIR